MCVCLCTITHARQFFIVHLLSYQKGNTKIGLNDLHAWFMYLLCSSYLAPNIFFLSSLFCMDHWNNNKKGFLILPNFQRILWAVVTIFKLKSRRFESRCLDCSCFSLSIWKLCIRGRLFIYQREACFMPALYNICLKPCVCSSPVETAYLPAGCGLGQIKGLIHEGVWVGKRSRLEKRNHHRKTGGNRERKGKGVGAGEDSKCKTGGG